MKERLSNVGLLIRCGLAFLSRGRADAKVQHPHAVAIVQFGKLGDMVCTTPLFRAIKKASPTTRVVVVGDAIGERVLAGSTDVDRYIVCGVDIRPAVALLKEESLEVGVTTGPSSRAFALLYLAGIPTIVAPRVEGQKSSEGLLYRLLRTLGTVVPHRMEHYAPREYLRLLEPIGIVSDDTEKHLAISPAAHEKIDAFWQAHSLSGNLVIGISPSAGNKIKQWPPERFAAVAEYVQQRYGASVLLVAGPGDAKEVSAMRQALPDNFPIVDATGFSIEELKALVSRLSLFISVDTGPIYIAEALGIPTIDIVGPVDEREQPPIGPEHLVVVPPARRSPELYVMNPYEYNYREALRQVESITVLHVTHAVDRLVAQLHLP